MITFPVSESEITIIPYDTISYTKEKVTNLNVFIKPNDENFQIIRLQVVKLIQGYTLVKVDHEDTTKYGIDIQHFKEIFEEAKKVYSDIEILYTQIPLFV